MKTIWLCLPLTFALLASCTTATSVAPTPTVIPPVAPTSTEPPVTVTPVEVEFRAEKIEDIMGWWTFSSQGSMRRIHFLANGTIRTGLLENPSQFLHGTFSFDGDIVRVDEPNCGPGSYEAYVVQHDGQNHKLYFKVIEDPCLDRVREMTRGYTWVSP